MRESQDSILEGSSGPSKPPEEHLKSSQTPLQAIGSSGDSKSLDATKDLLPTAGTSTKTLSDPNTTYKRIIKSEIESIKEEHLSSTSSLNDPS
ncbi:hypothetical protein AVEN_138413-1, partial [Araneus ventricosus]